MRSLQSHEKKPSEISVKKTISSRVFSLRKRHPALDSIFVNVSWLGIERVFRLTIGLFLMTWIARYLGPKNFGLLNFSVAFVALFASFTSFGLNSVASRELIKRPKNKDTLLGTVWTIQLLGSFILILLATTTLSFLRNPDERTMAFVAILSFGSIGKAADFSRIWFESQTSSKNVAITEIFVFSLLALTRVALLLSNAPLAAFVWAICAESLLTGLGLALTYSIKGGNLSLLKPKLSEAKWMLAESWPLVLSTTLVLINFNIDKIMLAQIAGDFQVGIYTAATKLVESSYFIPMAISASVAPALTRAAERSQTEYTKATRKVFTGLTLISLSIGISLFLLSDLIIKTLYGANFATASSPLSIHAWTLVFVFHVSFRTRLFTIERRQKTTLFFSCLTVAVNIVCNFFFIPRWGASGASWGSLVSWGSSAVIFPFLIPKTRNQILTIIGFKSTLSANDNS